MNKIYITGANGLLGKYLSDYLISSGHNVEKLNRSDIYQDNSECYFRDIQIDINSIVIHCAYDFNQLNIEENINVNLAHVLLIACKKADSVFINISSLSAFEGCKSCYGQIKLSIEKLCSEFNQYSLRLGLFDSNQRIGLIDKMVKLNKYIPFYFFGFDGVLGGQYITNLNQFCIFLDNYIIVSESKRLPVGVYSIVSGGIMHINEILGIYLYKRCFKINWKFFWLALRIYEQLNLPAIRLKSDSLIGLVYSATKPFNLIDTSSSYTNNVKLSESLKI